MDIIDVETINAITEDWAKWVGFLIGFSGFLVALPTLKERFKKGVIGPISVKLNERRQRKARKVFEEILPLLDKFVEGRMAEQDKIISNQTTSLKHIMAENEQFKTYMYSTISQLKRTITEATEQSKATHDMIKDLKKTLLKDNTG